MKRTKRQHGPAALLALVFICMLIGEAGCTSGKGTAEKPGPASSGDADSPVGTVAGVSITKRQLTDQLLADYGGQTLRTLMLRIAVGQEAEAQDIDITDAEVDQELRNRSDGYDSEEEFYAAMREQLGMGPEELRKDARYRLQLEELATAQVEVPEADIDAYMQQHPEVFGPHTELRVSHIVTAGEEDARNVLKRLEQGEDFAQLAVSLSIDEYTSANGGDMGWIDAQDSLTDQAVRESALALEIGQATGPIKTAGGYEVVRLTGRQEKPGMDREVARREARRQLAMDQAVPMADLEQELLDKYGAQIEDSALQSDAGQSLRQADHSPDQPAIDNIPQR